MRKSLTAYAADLYGGTGYGLSVVDPRGNLSTNAGDTPLPPISTAAPDMSNEKNYPKYLWCIHT
jgi:hypothetical protein